MQYNMIESGVRIKEFRVQKGYKQEELADMFGISRSSMGRIDIGIRGCSVDLLIQLAEVLECSIDYIVCGKHPNSNLWQEMKEELFLIIRTLVDYASKL